MMEIESLTYGNYYHIYNRGIDSCNLFREADNYEYFLDLYDKYITPISETFAWVLMPNHFHLLVRLKDEGDAVTLDLTGFKNLSGLETPSKPPHQYFSNLFNAYTKAYNKRFGRHGNLFERPFKRKVIDNEWYLKQVILYIHNNPVYHKFCDHPMEYPWSSYLACVSVKPTKLNRDKVIGWFDDQANFTQSNNFKFLSWNSIITYMF